MENKCISIIIPVYNCEKYISRCLRSIINQTYKNLQIIVVNDGSTDNTLNICEDIARNDSRIEIYSKENGGVSSARNLGLKKVKGDYISFVDADDFLEVNMFSKMIYSLKDEDLIVCNFYIVDEKGNKENGKSIPNVILNKNETLIELLLNRLIIGALWNKLFKKSILENVEFNTSYTIGEDLLFEFFAINNSKKIKFISDKLYNYYVNSNNVTSTSNYKKWDQVIEICNIIRKSISDKELIQYMDIKEFKTYRLIIEKLLKSKKIKSDDINMLKIYFKNSKKFLKVFLKNKSINVKEKIYTMILLIKARITIINNVGNV